MNTADLLVVDDTPESLRVLITMLQQRGFRVRSASNGKRALFSAHKAPPDLILLDICMPEMDGYEVCRRLKQDELTRDVPVLFISSLDDTVDKLRAFQEGGVDYITKPFQEAEVMARIEKELTILQQRRQIQDDFLRLARLEQMRDDLTHMLVHDLRSPLTGIIGYAQLLRRVAGPKLAGDESDWLGKIKDLSASLVEMVSSILDVSRLESEELPLDLKSVPLKGLVLEAVASLGALEGRTVEVEGAPEVTAHCDPELIRRVVVNLASNALRYSPTVTITLSQTGDQVETRVCDQGPGIAPENQQRIFEKFAQVPQLERQGHHHSGLGLTFCKLVVEKHQGQIGVESAPGQGSQFWIRLPAAQPGAVSRSATGVAQA